MVGEARSLSAQQGMAPRPTGWVTQSKELSANVALRGKISQRPTESTTATPRILWVARSWHNSQEIRNEKGLMTEYY